MNPQKVFLHLQPEIIKFEQILKNPELLTQKPFLLKKFFILYTEYLNCAFFYEVGMFVSENELEASNLEEFQKVFLPRTQKSLFETFYSYKNSQIKQSDINESVFFRIWDLVIQHNDFAPTDVPVSSFYLENRIFPCDDVVNLFELESLSFLEFTERANSLIDKYNLALLELFRLKFLRNEITKNLFRINKYGVSQLYFMFFLFSLDYQLISLLKDLKFFHGTVYFIQDTNSLYQLESKSLKFRETFDRCVTEFLKDSNLGGNE